MHNNYYFLKQLVPVLQEKLMGKEIVACFSQEKDELVLIFTTDSSEEQEDTFVIRASFRQEISSLLFPERFDRARRNSVNLFGTIIGSVVKEVYVFENERAIGLTLSTRQTFVFKLFGTRSNCILFNTEGQVEQVFQKRLKLDFKMNLSALHRPIDQTYAAFVAAEGNWQVLFPTFGKLVTKKLKSQLSSISDSLEQWNCIQTMLAQLSSKLYYLTMFEGDLHLSLCPLTSNDEVYDNPIDALNAFYIGLSKVNYLEKERAAAVKQVDKLLKKTEAYLVHNYQRLEALLTGSRNEEIGHILMANLHQIDTTKSEVELLDFYTNTPILIPLKKGVAPQKLAETYYRKAKNEQIEIKNLEVNIESRENYLADLKAHREALLKLESVKSVRDYLKLNGLLQTTLTHEDPQELFNTFTIGGYTVLVGRNAKNNDLLTKQFAKKEDLWLHARDVPGSHVVIRQQAGKRIPTEVIERAAELAAWFSKRKTDSLCPVIVTPKKYVRKTKGLPEGAFLIDREEVILVKPTPPSK